MKKYNFDGVVLPNDDDPIVVKSVDSGKKYNFDGVVLPNDDDPIVVKSVDSGKKYNFDGVVLPNDDDPAVVRTRERFERTINADSDREAAIENFAKEKNLTLEYVRANYDKIKPLADTVPTDDELEEAKNNKPATFEYFQKDDNVKVSKDDFRKMGVFETAVRAFIDKNKPANIFDSIIDGLIPNVTDATSKTNETINVMTGQKQAVKKTLAMNRLSDLSERLQRVYDSVGRKVDMPNIDKEVQELQNVLAEQYPSNTDISSWLSPMTEFGSQMIFSLKAGAEKLPEYVPTGAVLGMGYGAMAGGVGAIPGIIAGAGSGVVASMFVGGFDYAKKTEGGLAYLEYVNTKEKDGNYIDVAKAKKMANIVGNINGAFEVGADIIGGKLLKPVVKLIAPKVLSKAIGMFAKAPGMQKVLQGVFDNPKYANMPLKKAIREAVKDMAIGAGSETGTEYLQNIISEMGSNKLKENNYTTSELLNKFNADYDIKNATDVEKNYDTLSEHDKMLWNNRMTSWPEIMTQSMQGLGSVFKGGFMLGAIGGTSKGITSYRAKLQQNRENNIKNNLSKLSAADSKTEQLQAIGDIAKDIKTVSRSPEKTEQFVQNIVSGSAIDNIYIDAEKLDVLCQTAKIKKDELINKLGIDAEQFNVDSKISANIKVPFAKWVSVATQIEMPEGKNLYEVALGDIKDSEDGISQNEKTEIFNEQKTALDQALKRAEEFTTEEDIKIKDEVETFYNTLLDEAQPEGMREDIWQKQKEGIVKLYTAQALTEMKNRGWNYTDWLDNKKMGNLRVKNNMSAYRLQLKEQATEMVNEILNNDIELQMQESKKNVPSIIDMVIKAGGLKFDEKLQGEQKILSVKESGIKGLVSSNKKRGRSVSAMAEHIHELLRSDYGLGLTDNAIADEQDLLNYLFENIPNYKKQQKENTGNFKNLNYFALTSDKFKKQYEKDFVKKLPEDAKSMRMLHQDLIREAIKQGVPVEKNVLEDLNINPQYVDKRKFESAIKDESLFNSDNYFQSAEIKNRENKIFERFNKFLNKEIIAIQPDKSLSKKEAEKVFKNNKNVKHNELGDTVLPVETVNKILRHKGFDTSTIIDYISDLYKKSILIDTQTEKQYVQAHKQHNNIALWHNTLNKFKINNDNYVIRFTVAERKVGENKKKGTVGERYLHSTFISNIDIEKIKDGNTMNTSNNLGRVLPSDNILADYIKIVNNKLFQKNINVNKKLATDEIVRGFITKDNEINILPHSDASTFIHEMGHYWLRDLQKYVNENQAPAQVQKDWETIKQWLGIQNDNDVITTQQQETYARAVEQYMMEGKAPTQELKSIFRKIASWIKYIYKKLSFNNVQMSEDIKNYFDRLFATEDEIAYSNDKVLYNFDKELAGADPEIKAGFDEMRKEAHDQAVEILLPETMKELSAEYKANLEEKKKQFIEEATAEIKQSTVYKAAEQIKKNFKKNIDTIIKLYNDNKLSDDNIIDLNLTAEDYGYTSGDHLIKEIEKLGNAEEQINNLVNQKMQDYNETVSSPEFLEAEATRALHNEKALDLIALERELLINKYYKKEISMLSATTKAQIYKNMAKEKAREILENLPVKEAMRFQKYFVAEKKTAQRYAAAMAKNDIENALKYKQQMLMDFALVKESVKIKNEYLKIEAKLKKVSQRDIKLFGNEENFSQVANILERFGFYHKDYYPEYRKQSLADYAESINTWIDFDNTKKTEARIVIDPFVLNENNKGPLKDLSIDEVEAIEQSVDNIIHYVNNENKTTKVLQGQDIDMVVRDAVEQLQKNVPKELQKKNTKLNSQRDFEKQISLKDKFVKSFIMPGIKLDSVLKVADGYKDGGLFYQLFGRPVKEAMDQEAQMARDIFQKYTANFEKYYDENERKNFFAKNKRDFEKKKIYVDQFKNSFTREELIAIALNMGNESNRERLFTTPIFDYKGVRENWGESLVVDVLSKNLTEKDWQFVQSIWDLLEEYGEKHFEMHKRITGFSPVKIKAMPFTAITKDGKKIELKGGYYPLSQDTRSDEKAELRIEARKPEYEANIFIKPTTKKGNLQTRKKNAKYPIQLQLNVFEQALADTIHDIAFRELLFDLNRIMAKKEFKNGVKNTLGLEAYKKFDDQVRACGIIQNVYQDNANLQKIFNYFRAGVGPSMLALKPGILLQNFANIFIYRGAVDRFGKAEEKLLWFKMGMEFKDLANPWSTKGKAIKEFVYSKSSMMKDRQDNIDYAFSQAEKCLFGKKDKLLRFANYLMVFTDNITAIPAWQIMYEKAINDGLSEKDAINEADLLITRVVGNGRRLDQAEFVRSTDKWIKLINPFATFTINMLNMWYLQSGKAIDFKKYQEFAKFTVTQLFIFAIVSEIFSGRPPAEMDSGDEWAKWILTTMGGYIISMLPFIRSFFPGIMEMAVDGKNRTYGRNVSPVFDSINKAIAQPGIVAVKGINKILTTNKYKKGELQNDLETMTEGALVNYRLPKIVGAWFWNLYDMFDKGMTPKVSDAFKRRPRKERKGNKMFKI